MSELRDHSRPCKEHEGFTYKSGDIWVCGWGGCPGGAVVTIEELEQMLQNYELTGTFGLLEDGDE